MLRWHLDVQLEEQPRVEEWMDQNEIQFRLNAKEILVNHLTEHYVLPDDSSKIEKIRFFSHVAAERSVVAKINTKHTSYVVKASHRNLDLAAEAYALSAWQERGVRVPNIYGVHRIADWGWDFSILEYIDQPLVAETVSERQLLDREITNRIGSVLAAMHQVHEPGFGKIVEVDLVNCRRIRGEYTSFGEEIEMTVWKNPMPELEKAHILDESVRARVKEAEQILSEDLRSSKPVLIHGDLRPENLFITPENDLIVFDPNVRITHPSTCLGLTLIRMALQNRRFGDEIYNSIIESYREKQSISDEILWAGQLIRAVKLLYAWHWKRKIELRSALKEWIESKLLVC